VDAVRSIIEDFFLQETLPVRELGIWQWKCFLHGHHIRYRYMIKCYLWAISVHAYDNLLCDCGSVNIYMLCVFVLSFYHFSQGSEVHKYFICMGISPWHNLKIVGNSVILVRQLVVIKMNTNFH